MATVDVPLIDQYLECRQVGRAALPSAADYAVMQKEMLFAPVARVAGAGPWLQLRWGVGPYPGYQLTVNDLCGILPPAPVGWKSAALVLYVGYAAALPEIQGSVIDGLRLPCRVAGAWPLVPLPSWWFGIKRFVVRSLWYANLSLPNYPPAVGYCNLSLTCYGVRFVVP